MATAPKRPISLRFFRGLALGLTLSLLNLVGMFLTILLIGGLGTWTRAQFIGIFGLFEIATGLAFIICPNVWRLPIIEAETSRKTPVCLTASTLFLPHWAAGAKAFAGVVMVVYAGGREGFGPASVSLIPFTLLVAIGTVAISTLIAAWGIRRPHIDVVFVALRRANRDPFDLPGISITASALQIILGTFTLPVIKLMDPDAFFHPAFAASPTVLVATFAGVALLLVGTLLAWRGRIKWKALPEQQRLAEQTA